MWETTVSKPTNQTIYPIRNREQQDNKYNLTVFIYDTVPELLQGSKSYAFFSESLSSLLQQYPKEGSHTYLHAYKEV
jgi:deoxyribodipyrimidine photolyase